MIVIFYSLPSYSQFHFNHMPKQQKYIIPRGYNIVGKGPQTTEKLLDLQVLLLLYVPVMTLEDTFHNSQSSVLVIPITQFTLKELTL